MSFSSGIKKRNEEHDLVHTCVPEWKGLDGVGPNGEVYAKPLTIKQFEIADKMGQREGTTFARLAKLAHFALRDESGNYLIRGQNEFEEFRSNADGELLGRVLRELGIFNRDDDIEELSKNSETTDAED